MFIIIICLFSCDYKEIKENKKITYGRIVGYSRHYRSYAFYPEYTFIVNGNNFTGESSGAPINLNYWNNYNGKIFPVVYSSKNPQKCIMLIRPKDFEEWGLKFPDSLNWVKGKMDW